MSELPMVRPGVDAHLAGRDPRPDSDLIAALVVTFHPDPAVAGRIAALRALADTVVVVDNGSTERELAPIRSLVGGDVAELIENGANLGVGAALNVGFEWAERRSHPWVLAFDQDTTARPYIVSEAARVFDALPDPPPAVISAGWGTGWAVADPGGPVVVAITAGALHSVAAWRSLGGFREDFFIDYVDTEYSLRARSAGWAVLGVRLPTIDHVIGRPTRHVTPLRSFTVTNHDRTRRYYITRNRLHVWRRYWRGEPRYVTRDVIVAIKEFPKIVLFESDRRGKLLAIAHGGFDGLRGATGRLDEARRP